eukprot:356130-Chlamydomonas_euryale.AAC.6
MATWYTRYPLSKTCTCHACRLSWIIRLWQRRLMHEKRASTPRRLGQTPRSFDVARGTASAVHAADAARVVGVAPQEHL